MVCALSAFFSRDANMCPLKSINMSIFTVNACDPWGAPWDPSEVHHSVFMFTRVQKQRFEMEMSDIGKDLENLIELVH